MNEISEYSVIAEIENEHRKIEDKWRNLHYRTVLTLVLLGFLIECALGLILYQTGYITIPFPKYAMKYIAAPFLCNACLILAGIWTMRAPRLGPKSKTYAISLLFVGVCFVFYTVHIVFSLLYLIFTGPILLTIVYGDRALTNVTAFFGIALKIISDLFITWDPDKISPLADEHELTNFLISIFSLAAFYLICVIVIRFEKEKNAAVLQKEYDRCLMERKLITDELTQVYNRTGLRNAFRKMEDDTSGTPYHFVMMDLDFFKKLNDGLGHIRGDQCLREFGRILRENCADGAMPFRFGGDEFCILFKGKTLNHIIAVCKRIQNRLKESPVNDPDIPLTASMGIARYEKPMSASQLLQIADTALYRSKESKDAICVFSQPDGLPRESS